MYIINMHNYTFILYAYMYTYCTYLHSYIYTYCTHTYIQTYIHKLKIFFLLINGMQMYDKYDMINILRIKTLRMNHPTPRLLLSSV